LTNSYIRTKDKTTYHTECFKCIGCQQLINPSVFVYYTDNDGINHPCHSECYSELFGIKCVVCNESIPVDSKGAAAYIKHPFFDEKMCPKHAYTTRRCTSCDRFEPIQHGFPDLGDVNRCSCLSCCRSIVIDNEDAKPLWKKVIKFIEGTLEVPVWDSMRNIPTVLVGFEALNAAKTELSQDCLTRGLCVTECEKNSIEDNKPKSERSHQQLDSYIRKNATKTTSTASNTVSAILCLSGLCSDLTASILAHEATHAWFRLHPYCEALKPIPQQVEEGCCQLVARLYLASLKDVSIETYEDGGPSDEMLRRYFMFNIESDHTEIYGEGYRKAAKIYDTIGIDPLLSYVVMNRTFPAI